MANTKKVSVSIDSDLYERFEKLREEYGESNRSKEIQKALKVRVKQWERRRLEEQCREAEREIDTLVEDSYKAQGDALRSRN